MKYYSTFKNKEMLSYEPEGWVGNKMNSHRKTVLHELTIGILQTNSQSDRMYNVVPRAEEKKRCGSKVVKFQLEQKVISRNLLCSMLSTIISAVYAWELQQEQIYILTIHKN